MILYLLLELFVWLLVAGLLIALAALVAMAFVLMLVARGVTTWANAIVRTRHAQTRYRERAELRRAPAEVRSAHDEGASPRWRR